MSNWVRRYLDAWDSHDPSQVGAFMANDATYEDLPLGVLHEGREAIEAFVGTAHQLSNDYRFTFVSEQQTENQYAVEWEMAGTNTGELPGLPANKKPFRIRGMSVGRRHGEGKKHQKRG